MLEPEELDDRYFMLRVRIDGGRLSNDQLRVIAYISRRYARGTADVTDRQNIQLHWIEIENVPDIWEALESVGLSTTEACGDTPRVILGCPLAGIDADEIVDGTPEIAAIGEQYIGDAAFSNLPRKFKTAISGCPAQCAIHEINDVAFVGVVNARGEAGYDLWVGGGLSTNPMIGKRLGAFVRPGQVAEVWAGVTGLFRDYGYRRLRHRARIKFLVADWGPEKFREVLEKEYLGYALPDGPAPDAPRDGIRDHVGVHPQRDGNYYVGFAPVVGRLSADALDVIADLAARYGSGRVHTTTEQKMVILDVPPERTVAEQNAEFGGRLYARNPDLCCAMRKVQPLERTLRQYDAWLTGVRREETSSRRHAKAVEWDARRQMVKVNPIVGWTQDQVDEYIDTHGILVNPLVPEGYPSIGCATCTLRVEPGADPRSGRWAGTGKSECGIHD